MKEGTEITTHAYGLTRTFADILIALDRERHYTSPEDAISDLFNQLRRFRGQDSEVAYLSVKILMNVINDPKMFTSKSVNVDYLRKKIFDAEQFETEYKRAFDNHCREKLANLVSYLNVFRRYSSPDEIRYDLFHRIPSLRFTPCGPASDIYYFDVEDAGLGYPLRSFTTVIENNWAEITTDGALDADKLRGMLFDHHSNSCDRSCGEGLGLNRIPDYLEYEIAKWILEEDENYIKVHSYFIPKEDMSLPVYHEWGGKINFTSSEEKGDFIRKIQDNC